MDPDWYSAKNAGSGSVSKNTDMKHWSCLPVFEVKTYNTEIVGILMFLQIGGKFVKAEQYGEEVEEEEELILSQVCK